MVDKNLEEIDEKEDKKSSEFLCAENLSDEQKNDVNPSLEISNDIVEEKLTEAFKTQNPKQKRKSTIVSLILLLINIIFMAFIVKSLISNMGDDGRDLNVVIKEQGSKMWWLLGGVAMYGVYMFTQFFMYHVLIKDLSGKSNKKLAYDVAVVGKYYDNVTPFAVGGQPMQIVSLSKNGISPGVSTSIPIIKLMINSIVTMMMIAIFFIFGLPRLPYTSAFNDFILKILEILGVIGLIITVFITSFMVLMASGNFVTRSFISKIIKFGYRLKFVKNYRQSLRKTINQVAEYRSSMRYLWRNKKVLIKLVLLSVIECLSYAVMPFFVVQAFETSLDLNPVMLVFISIVQYFICSMASSFIPLPGGTGLMEISFIFLFGAGIINLGDNIVWALLAWRFLSYYFILIHGFTHELYKIVKNIIVSRKKRET